MSKALANQSLLVKPPVVAIMGHVDHGKTTLLDKIRHTKVTESEHGGITQHIGAYQIDRNGGKITFIDTPGHAAFSKMRQHGAMVTDIAILVVAADDGVKPQTKESIRHIKTAGVPVIVAINKMDVRGASPEMVKAQLVEDGINVEGYGGSVPVVEISARDGVGIDKLLDTVLILAELEEFKADPNAPLEAVVIESEMKKNQGPTASVIVKNGTLKAASKLSIVSGEHFAGTARRLISDSGHTLSEATPSTPVQIIGLKTVPPVGTILTTQENGFVAPVIKTIEEPIVAVEDTPTLPEFEKIESPTDTTLPVSESPEESKEKISIKIILKSDTLGTLDAIAQNLGSEVTLLDKSVGDVTDSDVLMAESTGAAIIAFNVRIPSSVKKLAIANQIPIRSYNIIYKLLEDFEKQVLKLLEPTIDEEQLGVAIVRATFTIRDQTVAGCAIDSGAVTINSRVHLKRDKKIITDATVISLKQGKEDVKIAKAGTECGIVLKPRLDIKVGDKIISYKKIEEQK